MEDGQPVSYYENELENWPTFEEVAKKVMGEKVARTYIYK